MTKEELAWLWDHTTPAPDTPEWWAELMIGIGRDEPVVGTAELKA